MQTKYTVETYEGDRSVVGRQYGIICETYFCGDMSAAEAKQMAREMAAEQDRVELARELEG